MDKRFFLALFLSLIAIAVSQLLFPPAKPAPSSQRSAGSIDSAGSQLSAASASSTRAAAPSAAAVAPGPTGTVARVGTSAVETRAETTAVSTEKAIYKFSGLGATPVSAVLRDYKNRSGSDGPVQFAIADSPLLRYRLITPADTVDLSRVPFALSRTTAANGNETLTYTANAASHTVSIAYTISKDTSASYLVRVDGEVTGAQPLSYLITELPTTLQPTEADTIGDHRTLAYSLKPERDRARSVLFGSLDPGEKTLVPGPLTWIALKNKYFVFGILSLPNSTLFSEATLTGGPRTSKIATTASACV